MDLVAYEAEVRRRARAGDAGWLARELVERVRVNVGLVAANAELGRQRAACVARHGGTAAAGGEDP